MPTKLKSKLNICFFLGFYCAVFYFCYNISMRLYHGSFYSNLIVLEPNSRFHDDPTKKVVYLTENKAYSLFYIWDAKHNNLNTKYVTCWIKNDIVHYEEQFSDQLFKLYNGVSGYVYYFDNLQCIKAKEPQMWAIEKPVKVNSCEFIANVYDKILEYEKNGKIVVHRYNELTENERKKIDEKMAKYIKEKCFADMNREKTQFIRSNLVNAWKLAENMK